MSGKRSKAIRKIAQRIRRDDRQTYRSIQGLVNGLGFWARVFIAIKIVAGRWE